MIVELYLNKNDAYFLLQYIQNSLQCRMRLLASATEQIQDVGMTLESYGQYTFQIESEE